MRESNRKQIKTTEYSLNAAALSELTYCPHQCRLVCSKTEGKRMDVKVHENNYQQIVDIF